MSKLKARLLPCIFRNRKGTRKLCLFLLEKRIIFANNIKSRSFYFSFDIARRYAKHREHDYLYATANRGGPVNRLVNNVAITKNLTSAGVGLSIVSAGLTLTDAINKGKWENHHTADLIVNGALTTLSFTCPIAGLALGGTYFILDIGSQYLYHKSLTEKLFDE